MTSPAVHRTIGVAWWVGVIGLAVIIGGCIAFGVNLSATVSHLQQDNAALAEQIRGLGAKPVTEPEAPPEPSVFRGDTGTQGVEGDDGRDGRSGVDGTDGSDGKDGDPGTSGPPGGDGKDGTNGQPGADGATVVGPQGAPGEPGPQGTQGMPGQPGAEGPQGLPGYNGSPPTVFAFVVDGVTYSCTDADGDLFYECSPPASAKK